MALKTLRDGSIVESRIVRHRDKTVSIKRQTIAVPVRPAREDVAAVPITIDRSAIAIRPDTKTAKRNAKKPKEAPKLATPQTYRERTHHESFSTDRSAYVTTTNIVPKILRRAQARNGSHVEAFQRDYEMAHTFMKSPNMEVSTGGQPTPFSLAAVQAVDRLKAFREKNERAFLICEAVLVHGTNSTTVAKIMKTPNRVATEAIRDAVDDLAGFYTPQKKRPDKKLAAIAKFVEEQRLRA